VFEPYQHIDFFQSPAIVSASMSSSNGNWFLPFLRATFMFSLIFIIAGLAGLTVEVWLMKYYRWAGLPVCIGDALLLNLACGIGIWLLSALFPRLMNVIVCLCLTILIKGFLTDKLSDLPQRKAWIICTIATIASYIVSSITFFAMLFLAQIFPLR
jgi:hypothetical protein